MGTMTPPAIEKGNELSIFSEKMVEKECKHKDRFTRGIFYTNTRSNPPRRAVGEQDDKTNGITGENENNSVQRAYALFFV